MASTFGHILRVSVFGQSHGTAVGVCVDGLPAGVELDMGELRRFLDRRRPGKNSLSTARKEADIPRFVSGLLFPEAGGETSSGAPDGEVLSSVPDGTAEPGTAVTCGTPLVALIANSDSRSSDYEALRWTPRPGHADYTAWLKWGGMADTRGGGHFSGRLTAPLCVAGGIAKQVLAKKEIFTGAHLASVGTVEDSPFPLWPTAALFEEIAGKPFPVIDGMAGERMRDVIAQARAEQDSVGGVVECATVHFPGGLGNPMFDGLESRLAAALFGIPAVKGVEFGAGFGAARLRGSENNDPFVVDPASGGIVTEGNHCGGILGGISDGMPLTLRVAFKPTPSIGRPQRTVNLQTGRETELRIHGRHDPCIAHRAVPVVEAVTALVLLDALLEGGHGTL